jgi:hypothetical protein
VRRSYHIFLAYLLCQLLDTPTRCRDRGFQTQATDDLLEYGIWTPLDRAAGSDFHAIAVFYIGTVQPSQLKSPDGQALQQQRAHMRLLVTLADDVHHISTGQFERGLWLAADVLQRAAA